MVDIPSEEILMPCGDQFHVRCFVNRIRDIQKLVEIPNSAPVAVYDVNAVNRNGELVVDRTRGTPYRRKALAFACPHCREQDLSVDWTDARRAQLTQVLTNAPLLCLPGEVYLEPDDGRQAFFPEAQLPDQRRILAYNGLLIWLPDGVDTSDLRDDNGKLVHLPTKVANARSGNDDPAIRRDVQALKDALDGIADQAGATERPYTFISQLARIALSVMAKYWEEEPSAPTLVVPGKPNNAVPTDVVVRVRMMLEHLSLGNEGGRLDRLDWAAVAARMRALMNAI